MKSSKWPSSQDRYTETVDLGRDVLPAKARISIRDSATVSALEQEDLSPEHSFNPADQLFGSCDFPLFVALARDRDQVQLFFVRADVRQGDVEHLLVP